MKRWLPVLFLLGALPAAAQTPDGPVVVPSGQRQIEITIPRDQSSVVRDQRTVHLDAGRSRLRFFEVPTAASLDLASLQLSIGQGVRVLDQRRDDGAAEALNLSCFLGRKVTLLRQIGDTEKPVTGTLLRTSPVLLDTAEGVLLDPPGTWLLPKEAISNSAEPVGTFLEWPVEAPQAGDHNPELLYATKGFNWSASYSARLNQAHDRLSFRGWLALSNDTGAAYPGTKLHLITKEGKRWDWPEPVNLNRDGAVLLLADADVPVQRRLTYYNHDFDRAFQSEKPSRSVAFKNNTANGMGLYLPAGPITLWSQDEDGNLLLSKADAIGSGVNPDGDIALAFGTDDNLFVSRDIKTRLLNPVTREWTVTWTITATKKGVPRTLSLHDRLPSDAKITESSQKLNPTDFGLDFDVTVAPEQTIQMKYVITAKV